MSLSVARLLAATLLALNLVVAAQAGAAVPVLVVEGLVGEASSEHLGERRRLQIGDRVDEREVLRTTAASRLSLRMANGGLIELGGDTALALEKLPTAPDARDLRSIVSLLGGYLRVLWMAPALESAWPFVLYVGGQRASLAPGEYFFERRAESLRSCVAGGRLTVTAIAGDGVDSPRAGACHELHAGVASESQSGSQSQAQSRSQALSPAQFDAMRREYTTRPTGKLPPVEVPAAVAEESAPAGATPPPARPVIPPLKPLATAPVVVKPAAAARPAPTASAPVPAPATPVDGAAPAPGSGDVGWTLLIGSFGDPANAEQVQAKLRSIGMEPYVRVKQLDGRSFTSVQVRGGYATREIADAKAAEVRDKLGYPNVRVVYLQ